MRLDLIEVKPKNRKIKEIIFVLLVIFFIVFFSILGMYCAKLYKIKLIAQKKMQVKENVVSSKQTTDANRLVGTSEEQPPADLVDREAVKRVLLPVYSEKAKTAMKTIYKSSSKVAFLTFDDGPSQAVTPLILDVLKEENIKATFFVLGKNVKKNPELVKRAYLEGHYIANHGYTHNYSKIYKNADNVINEYNKTEKSIQQAIENNKYSSHLFRFPGGYAGGKYAKIKKKAGEKLNKNNISYIDWNALTGDAEGANTKEKIIKNIKKSTKNKGTIIVLMHDSSTKILTYETLKDVIQYLRKQGYTFDNFYSIMR